MIYDTGEEFMLSHIVKFVRYIRRTRLKIELDTHHRKRVKGYGVQSVLTEEQRQEVFEELDNYIHSFRDKTPETAVLIYIEIAE